MTTKYLVIGAGPVGSNVAKQLAQQGHRVTLLSRSGQGPQLPGIDLQIGDASSAQTLSAAAAGVSAIFHCAHAAYSAKAWQQLLPTMEQAVLSAGRSANAVVVFPESLYSYSTPEHVITEESPRAAQGGKRGVRTELLAARQASETNNVSVVASDFYGPDARTAHAGERMLVAALSGKRLWAVGNPDMPHSFTYIEDLARAMVTAAQREDLWNSVLHAPTVGPTTQRQFAQAYAARAGAPAAKVSGLSGGVLRAIGLVSPAMREVAEMSYQFDRPFVMNSAKSEKLLGLAPTPLSEGIDHTLSWWNATARP